jgi:hypothetical protein
MTEQAQEQPKTDIQKQPKQQLVVRDEGPLANLLDTARVEQMYRLAGVYSRSRLIPPTFQGKPDDCFVICELALRLGTDPFMLFQNMYVIKEKPAMEAKLMIALVNTRGPFSGPIQWRLEGAAKTRKCTAYATHRITGEVCEATVTWDMVEREGWEKNPKWTSMPDIMFRYRSASFLCKLYAPDCLMGMQTREEMEDVITVEAQETPALALPGSDTPNGGKAGFGAFGSTRPNPQDAAPAAQAAPETQKKAPAAPAAAGDPETARKAAEQVEKLRKAGEANAAAAKGKGKSRYPDPLATPEEIAQKREPTL